MKRFLFLFIPLLFLLTACDKQKRTAKNLSSGDWQLISYKVTDPEGLSEFSTCDGILHFDNATQEGISGTYSMNYTFQFPGNTGSMNFIQNGEYNIIEKGNYMTITSQNPQGVSLDTATYRILVQTKTDLELEYPDTLSQIHTYIFKRIN